MSLASILSKVPRRYKLWLKARLAAGRVVIARTFRSFGDTQLLRALRAVGVHDGDTVMLHGSFAPEHGFRGTIHDLTKVFIDAVGPNGNLLMVSLPYRTSTIDYLEKFKQFDVRKTPSMMGLMSEFFRRRPDVVRSVHPTHPVLAHGARARWFIEDHPGCVYPTGPDTPFDRLAQCDGLVVFFNVGFDTFTFFHYLEHVVSPDLPFSLYTDEPFEVAVVDERGERRTVRTHAFSRDAIRRRRPLVLEDALRSRGLIVERRVGNSRILAVRVQATIALVRELAGRGVYFYDMSTQGHPVQASTSTI